MAPALAAALGTPRRLLERWLFRLRGAEPAPIVLLQRRVFVLPTGAGLAYGFTLILLLVGSINYLLGLGFVLTFLLAGLGVVAILHTFRNLAHLRIEPGRVEPVFAGEAARFVLLLANRRPDERLGLRFALRDGAQASADVPGNATAAVELTLPAPRRGWLSPGRITVDTRYPLGLIRAWSYIEPDMRALVYPAPERDPPPLPWPEGGAEGARSAAAGADDFAGLRGYQPSDSPRHVAWKSVARDGPLLTKQFAGGGTATLWLDYAALPAALGVEARLARLTAYVLQAGRAGVSYGLRLPGRSIAPGRGQSHAAACLEALALFGGDAR